MKIKMHQRFTALLSAGLLGLACTGAVLTTADALAQPDKSKKTETAQDTLILRDGRTVKGKILKETEKEIQFLIVMDSGLSAESTYARSEILEVRKGESATPAPKGDDSKKQPVAAASTGAPGPKVYMFTMTGEFSRDISLTPMKRIMEDAKKCQPDFLVVKVDCDFKMQGQEEMEFAQDEQSYNQLILARQIEPLMTDQVEESPEWKVKPRMVFWIKKALGGVAFLPFFCKELYYTSDAKHGGIGYLDYLFEGIGDEVVREKQRSLREGWAEGLCVHGGHPVEILRGMARVDYVLSVTFVGGQPQFHEDTSGEVLLTDDGNLAAGRRDTFQEIMRFTGNDVITLTAENALRLGMSNGTVDTEDELFEKFGISRSNPVKVGKADAILQEWSKAVVDAETQIRKYFRDLEQVKVKAPGGYNERTAARGQRKKILKDTLALLEKYKEAINPRNIRAYPEQLITGLKLEIDKIETEQRLDKPEKK